MSYSPTPARANSVRRAIVPAAGLGTRLRPLTLAFPKELLPVGRLPVLGHIAAELAAADIDEVLFIVSERKPQIRGFFGDSYRDESTGRTLRCEYVLQRDQRGLGDALLCAEEWASGKATAVAFGDCIIESPEPAGPLRRLLDLYHSTGACAAVLTETVARERVSRYGVLAPRLPRADEDEGAFEASDVIEKPSPEAAPSRCVVAARYVLGPAVFSCLHRVALDSRGELNLTDAVRLAIQEGGNLWASPLHTGEFRRDIGNYETFFAAFVRAAMRDPELGDATRRVVCDELRT